MESLESKMQTPDRILELSAMEGKKALDSIGNSDKRLFTGENKLHAVMDTQTTLWKLRYDMGAVPSSLKGSFTSFRAVLQHAKEYYNQRNIEIKEIKN